MCCHASALGGRSQGRYRGGAVRKGLAFPLQGAFCDNLEARHPSSPGLGLETREIRTDGFRASSNA